MYCNNCLTQIPKDELTYCSECGVPLHKKCTNHCADCGIELCDSCYKENHFRCSDCFDIDKPFKYLRRSYIKQYEDCPHSLYLQLIKGIEPPMNRYAQLGIICHEVFELAQTENLTLKRGLLKLHNDVEDWNTNTTDTYSIIPDDLLQVGVNCINNFYTLLPLLEGKQEVEKKIRYSIDDKLPDITCTLDRIAFIGDEIHIHDWKTGKPLSGKNLETDLQPPLYIYAVYKEFGKLPETFNLHYLNKQTNLTYRKVNDNVYTVSTTRASYTLNIKDALERTKKILNGINKQEFPIPPAKKVGFRCKNLCWFGMSGKCKQSLAEEWRMVSNGNKNKED